MPVTAPGFALHAPCSIPANLVRFSPLSLPATDCAADQILLLRCRPDPAASAALSQRLRTGSMSMSEDEAAENRLKRDLAVHGAVPRPLPGSFQQGATAHFMGTSRVAMDEGTGRADADEDTDHGRATALHLPLGPFYLIACTAGKFC